VPRIAGASLNGAFDLDLWGKNRARLRAAMRETDAVRVEQAEARIAIAASIADAYVDLSRLYTARDVIEQTLRIQSDTAALVAERVQSGIETEAERRQARAFVQSLTPQNVEPPAERFRIEVEKRAPECAPQATGIKQG